MPRDVHLIPCLLLTLSPVLLTCAYDAYSACSKPFRTSKFYAEPPCDFRVQPWCTVPGSAYPWQAVRRFVRENQGLMRRMYGDERHISVLRAEIESNDVEYLTETEWKLREQVRLRYSSRTPAPPAPPPPSSSEPPTPTTSTVPVTTWRRPSESAPTPTTTPPPPPNTTLAAPELREAPAGNSSEPEEEPDSTTTAETGYETEAATEYPTTLPVETTTTGEGEGEGTTEQTTDGGKQVEDMTTMKESELFQAVRDPAVVVDKTPPLLKLKGVNACPVKEEVVAPFWANNTRGEILALLNVYPFEQYVHWEKCTYENKQMFCRNGCRCEQQYRLHRLLAYDPSNECRGIFSDWFKFPSCCVCRCYDLPIEFHITSRSPRIHNNEPPYWYKLKPFG